MTTYATPSTCARVQTTRRSPVSSPGNSPPTAIVPHRYPSTGRSSCNRPGPRPSEVAVARNELNNIHKEYHALFGQHEKVKNKLEEYRVDLKKLKCDYEKADKEARALRRSNASALEERAGLEAELERERERARKIEARLSRQGGMDLGDRCTQLKAALKEERGCTHAVTLKLSEAESENIHLQEQVRVLQGALEVRVVGLGDDQDGKGQGTGGGSVEPGLLCQVAKAREDCLAMATRLTQQGNKLNEREKESELLRTTVNELQFMREQMNEELRQLEEQLAESETVSWQRETLSQQRASELAEAEKSLFNSNTDLESLRQELESSKRELEAGSRELAQVQEAHQQALRRVEEQAREERHQLEQRAAQERAGSKAREERAWAAAEGARREAAEERARGERELQDTREALGREREVRAQAERERGRAEQRDQAAQQELSNLNSQLDTFTEVNAKLQIQLGEAEARRVAEGARAQELEKKMAVLEAQVAVARSERATAESALKGKLKAALQDLQELLTDRDQMKARLNEAGSLEQAAAVSNLALREEIKKLKASNLSLSKSKALLEKSLLEQVGSLQSQLEAALEDQANLRDQAERVQQARKQTKAVQDIGKQSKEAINKRYESEFLTSLDSNSTAVCTAATDKPASHDIDHQDRALEHESSVHDSSAPSSVPPPLPPPPPRPQEALTSSSSRKFSHPEILADTAVSNLTERDLDTSTFDREQKRVVAENGDLGKEADFPKENVKWSHLNMQGNLSRLESRGSVNGNVVNGRYQNTDEETVAENGFLSNLWVNNDSPNESNVRSQDTFQYAGERDDSHIEEVYDEDFEEMEVYGNDDMVTVNVGDSYAFSTGGNSYDSRQERMENAVEYGVKSHTGRKSDTGVDVSIDFPQPNLSMEYDGKLDSLGKETSYMSIPYAPTVLNNNILQTASSFDTHANSVKKPADVWNHVKHHQEFDDKSAFSPTLSELARC